MINMILLLLSCLYIHAYILCRKNSTYPMELMALQFPTILTTLTLTLMSVLIRVLPLTLQNLHAEMMFVKMN